MQVRWLGRSTFELKTAVGMVVFDPYPGAIGPGYAFDSNTVVAVSNPRLDRSRMAAFPGRVRIVDGPGEYEVSGLGLRGVATPLEDADDPQLINTVYVIEAEGINVCHLGSLRATLTPQALQIIGRVDVLMVSAAEDGLSPDLAAATVRQIEPTVILPMGYEGSNHPPAVARFLSELGTTASEPIARLVVTRSNLGEEQRVVILSRQDS